MQNEIVTQIEEGIVFGVYPPGSRLVEDRLRQRFGASRYGLRQALSHLQEMGLVEFIPNRGPQVVEPTPDEIDELYEIRALLESEAAARTELPVHPDIVERMKEIHARHAEAAEQKRLRDVFRLNLEFHSVQFSACPNSKLREAIDNYARKVHIVRAVKYSDPEHMREVVAQHAKIIEAMQGRDTWSYVTAVREHLPASSEAYRTSYELKHGGVSA